MSQNIPLSDTSSQRPSALNARLARHFAAGAVAAVVAATPASADIIYSSVNIAIPVTTAGVYLNVITGVTGITPAAVPGWDLNAWSTTTLSMWANNASSPTDGVLSGLGTSATLFDNLAPGTLIDGTSTYGRTPGPETTGSTTLNLNSSDNLVGFRFQNEANGNEILFGWLRIQLGASLNNASRFITEYAYENTVGTGIEAGAIPEPGTFCLLGLGGVGAFFALRRRR